MSPGTGHPTPDTFRSSHGPHRRAHAPNGRIDRRRHREQVAQEDRRPGEARRAAVRDRSEEHTSELQSLAYLVCRLLLEKKKIKFNLTVRLSINLWCLSDQRSKKQ